MGRDYKSILRPLEAFATFPISTIKAGLEIAQQEPNNPTVSTSTDLLKGPVGFFQVEAMSKIPALMERINFDYKSILKPLATLAALPTKIIADTLVATHKDPAIFDVPVSVALPGKGVVKALNNLPAFVEKADRCVLR